MLPLVTPESLAPARFVPDRLTPVSFAPVRSAPDSDEPARFAPVMFLIVRLEFDLLHPLQLTLGPAEDEQLAASTVDIAAVMVSAVTKSASGSSAWPRRQGCSVLSSTRLISSA